jgi:hypothetical protein
VYLINIALAVNVYGKAKAQGQPPVFWTVKTLVLGGLAYNELTQVRPAMLCITVRSCTVTLLMIQSFVAPE